MNDIILNNPGWCGVSRSRKEKVESGRKEKWEGGRKEERETSCWPLWYLRVTCVCAGVVMAFSKTDHLITSSVLYPTHVLIVFLVVFILNIFVYRCFVCIFICIICVCSAHGVQKRALDPLELELQAVLSCLTFVPEIEFRLFASVVSTCSHPLSHLSSPRSSSSPVSASSDVHLQMASHWFCSWPFPSADVPLLNISFEVCCHPIFLFLVCCRCFHYCILPGFFIG